MALAKIVKQWVAIGGFFCLGLFLLTGCGAGDEGSPPLIVGMDLSYPPFEMTDDAGKPSGVSVDLATALAEFLDRELVVQNMPFAGLIPALRTGRVDVVISSLTRTEERAKAIDFSEPYFRVGLALLVSRDSDVEAATELNASGRTVAVRTGTTGALWAAENLPEANVLTFQRESEALQEVLQARADAFIYDQISVARQAAQNPERARAILEPLQSEFWAIGLPKDSPLTAKVNAFLEAFRSEDRFEALADRYLADEKAAFAEQDVPFAFE
ncbi:MAG: transporter substrate-binding domain-containing protein [Opitutales bacterium]